MRLTLLLLTALRSVFRSHSVLELEILALRHQIGVLQRAAKKRPKLTAVDRLLWVVLSRFWDDWGSALLIVIPETLIAWHRKGFRLFRTWRVQGPARPTGRFPRSPGSDSAHESRKCTLGSAPYAPRVAQSGHRDRRTSVAKYHGPPPQAAFAKPAHFIFASIG
jgi:hypothetical protein